jgi:hypothetical protein
MFLPQSVAPAAKSDKIPPPPAAQQYFAAPRQDRSTPTQPSAKTLTVNQSPQFWEKMTVLGPVGCLVVLLVFGSVTGVFDLPMVGQEVSPLQGFTILAIMLFPMAAWFYVMVQRDVALSRMSRSWPTVPGVLEQRMAEQRSTLRGNTYAITLSYSYEAGGRKYRGDRLAFAPSRLDAGALLDGLLDKYPANAAVTVHYNPVDPQDSVLETDDAPARQRMGRVLMLLLLPVGLALLLIVRMAF